MRGPGLTNQVLEQVLADLTAEGEALEAAVAPLDEPGWRTPVPAEGWDVATTIVHLAWTDECALAAGTDKAGLGRAGARARWRTRRASSTPRRSSRREGSGRADPRPLASLPPGAGGDAARLPGRARSCRGSARR